MTVLAVLDLVALERTRATMLKAEGSLDYLASDPDCPNILRLAALAEELGEVARAVHDGDDESLAVELVQLAGVAVAWRDALC